MQHTYRKMPDPCDIETNRVALLGKPCPGVMQEGLNQRAVPLHSRGRELVVIHPQREEKTS